MKDVRGNDLPELPEEWAWEPGECGYEHDHPPSARRTTHGDDVVCQHSSDCIGIEVHSTMGTLMMSVPEQVLRAYLSALDAWRLSLDEEPTT